MSTSTLRQIQLWSVKRDASGPVADPVSIQESTQTEVLLEELLVRSPSLLAERLTIVGRQVPTEGGPLDLLGVDEDGRLVVFELKRGVLTRDAVAQVLDYASDLAESDPERIARLIQDYSGRLGVEKIEDFDDWYAESFPNSIGVLSEPPKMVLVGLGVDSRARRVVNFLADAGAEIELLTFHGFEREGTVFLARQVESVSPVRPLRTATASSPTKEGNLRVLQDSARSLGVLEFLEQVASFTADLVDGYQWPGKTAYTFSRAERTAEGNPTLRAYVTLQVNPKHPGSLTLTIKNRVFEAAKEALEQFRLRFPESVKFNVREEHLEVFLTLASWSQIRNDLSIALKAAVTAAAAKASGIDDSALSGE